jgi:tRNA dimethylallyltransferase
MNLVKNSAQKALQIQMKNFNQNSKTLIILAGPTAVGKTSLSIQVASEFETEIISADSRQFYKELIIGAAPPSMEELAKIRHHFIGHLSVKDVYNVSQYEKDALEKINELFLKHDSLVMVGGSGLFIHAVMHGIDELPDPDEELREHLKSVLNNEGIESLRLLLKELDPEYYHQVDLANPKRLLRALEVCIATGKKFSELRTHEGKQRNFKTLLIGLNRDREELNAIINKRTDAMMVAGFEEEARSLFELKHLNALNTVGYKELFEFIEGNYSLAEAVEKIKTNTRRYAKRQVTWFKKQNDIHWFHPSETDKILTFIQQNRS